MALPFKPSFFCRGTMISDGGSTTEPVFSLIRSAGRMARISCYSQSTICQGFSILRIVESISQLTQSSRSDGWPQCLPHCPRGSTRRTICCCANADRPGIALFYRTPDVPLRHSGERCASTGVRVRRPRARAWTDGPIQSGIPPDTGRRESSETFAAIRSGDS